MVCLELEIHCIEIESDVKVYALGKERLEQHAIAIQDSEIGGGL